MLSNFHTHSVFCDGKNTLEEVVLSAIEKGFDSLGFSGHGHTDYDDRYCMKDESGYIREINRLKEKYKDALEIYLGVEEDAFSPLERSRFDYIIGSSHYLRVGGEYLPIDSSPDCFKVCLEAFRGDVTALAESYYSAFCAYIRARRPDIIGHFDLITKYDELSRSLFLESPAYNAIAERYAAYAAEADCLFEVNTGAIARALRTSPYPAENLLYLLKEMGARLILSSDSHAADTLDFAFEETKLRLREIGFSRLYTLKGGKFISYSI